jgi:hypothetical protein
MGSNMNDERLWNEFNEMLTQIDTEAIIRGHLEKCDHKIKGYWHESEYYEEISFLDSICGELVSASLGITKREHHHQNWIQLKFLLSLDAETTRDRSISDYETRIGELTLIFDSHMEFLDEKWLINIKSPFVVVTKGVKP